jgi:hypothetical protein
MRKQKYICVDESVVFIQVQIKIPHFSSCLGRRKQGKEDDVVSLTEVLAIDSKDLR